MYDIGLCDQLPDDVLRGVLQRAWGDGRLTIDGSEECAQRRVLLSTTPRFTRLLQSMTDLHKCVDAECDAVAASLLAIVGPSVKQLTLRCPSGANGVEPREVLQHLSTNLVNIDLRLDVGRGLERLSLPSRLRRMRVEYDPEWLSVAANSGCTRVRHLEFVTRPAYFEFQVLRFCALVNQLRSVRRLSLVGASVDQAKQVLRHVRADIAPRFVVAVEGGEDANLLRLGELGMQKVRAYVVLRHGEYPPCFAYPCDDVEDFRLVLAMEAPGSEGMLSIDATAPTALRRLRVGAEHCRVGLDFEATFASLGAGQRRDVTILADIITDIGSPVLRLPEGADWTLHMEARSLPMGMLFALRREGAVFEVQDAGPGVARAVVASRKDGLP